MKKRILAFVLSLIMLCTSIPVITVSADKTDTMVFYDPFGDDSSCLKGISISSAPMTDESGMYMRFIAKPGTYNNNDLVFTVTDESIAILEFPYVKMEYRSDSSATIIDTTLWSAKGESWGASHPELKGDGKWHDFLWDLNDINLPENQVPEKDEKGVALRLKLWGSGNKTLTEESYFDIKYIAFFKTEEEAMNFNYDEYNKSKKPAYEVDPDLIKEGSAKLAEYNAECDALIEVIKNTPTTVEVTGTKYYVSADGNDDNDGKSPATAWKTIRKVSNASLEPGDGVFFKRGDYFRADGVTLSMKTGVTYSAYGEGDKPVLVGSVDASDPNKWHETDVPNVYKFATAVNNVGSVIINGGEHWGIMVARKDSDENITMENGLVDNGLDEPYQSPSRPWEEHKSLKNNLEFISLGGTTYLYCKDGNPGEVFDSIELSAGINGAWGSGTDVVFDNIKLFGYGIHGISVSDIKNFKVTNCIFGWIGGSIQMRDIRLGNAVQNWRNCEDFLIDHCWSYQVYDCCYTTQYSGDMTGGVTVKNVEFSNNVAEYSNSGPEIWNGKSLNDDKDLVHYENVLVHDSYTRNNGYGWSHQRPGKDGNFYYGAYHSNPTFNNFRVYNNKFFICYSVGLLSQHISEKNAGFVDNDYIIAKGKKFATSMTNVADGTGLVTDYYYTPETLAMLQANGVERDGEFYYMPEDYVPEPFNWQGANDFYTTGVYSDTADHWAKNYVKAVTNAGLFKGVSSDKFDPDGAMTRAMVYTVLSRFDHMSVSGGTKWYDGAVEWAIENGITTAELARPEDNITRGELALMIYKHMTGKHLKLDVKPASYNDSASFKAIDGADLDTVKKALDYCASAGLIMGDDAGNMRFDAATKRSEVAAVFARMYNFANSAEVDVAASEANGEIVKYDAEDLNKAVTLSWAGKELLEENGTKYLHIRPRTPKGTVEITLGQWNLPETDFYKYQYMKLKYRISGGEQTFDICICTNEINQWLVSGAGTRPENTAEDEWLLGMTRYCDFTGNFAAKTINASDKNARYIFKPFGNDTEIAEDAYLDIESIAFFTNEYVAKAYEW